MCWGDSEHIAFCNTRQNVAVLKELLLSRLDSCICTILPDLPSRAALASPSPLGLYVVSRVSRAEHKLSTLAPSASPIPIPSTGNYYTLPSVLVLRGLRMHWKCKRGKVPGVRKQVHLPSVSHPSCHTPERSCAEGAQEGIKSARVALMGRALTGGRHLICCAAFPGAVQYH